MSGGVDREGVETMQSGRVSLGFCSELWGTQHVPGCRQTKKPCLGLHSEESREDRRPKVLPV